MRCTQWIGLSSRSRELASAAVSEDTYSHTYGMFDEELPLTRYVLEDGRALEEYVEHEIWSSGPMLYTALRDTTTGESFGWEPGEDSDIDRDIFGIEEEPFMMDGQCERCSHSWSHVFHGEGRLCDKDPRYPSRLIEARLSVKGSVPGINVTALANVALDGLGWAPGKELRIDPSGVVTVDGIVQGDET